MGVSPRHKNPNALYITGDIRYRKHWLKALDGIDAIVHLASAEGVGQSFWQARKYTDVNIGGTATLFEILISNRRTKERIKKIVVASSKSLYGEGAYRCVEHGILFPWQRPIYQPKKRRGK